MTQYDAGPGDWSDREWEMPGREQKDQVKKRRFSLPPWAMLAALVAAVILLCVGLVLIVQAIRGGREAESPTAEAEMTGELQPPATEPAAVDMPAPVPMVSPSPTIAIPGAEVPLPTQPTYTVIEPGASVVTINTEPLRMRDQPTLNGAVLVRLGNGTILTVVDGPREADGYTWWMVRTEGGREGWVAGSWLELEE